MRTYRYWIVTIILGIVFCNLLTKADPPKLGESPPAKNSENRKNATEPSQLDMNTKDSCAKVATQLGYNSKSTAIQKDAIWEKYYADRKIKWTVQLISAEKVYDDSFDVTFVCLPPTKHPTLLVMNYPEQAKDRVLKFNKGKRIQIEAKLKAYEVPPDDLSDKVDLRLTAEPVVD